MTTPDAIQPADVSWPLLETTCGSVLRDATARYPEVPARTEDAALAGLTLVTVNPLYRAAEAGDVLRRSGARLLPARVRRSGRVDGWRVRTARDRHWATRVPAVRC